MSCSQIPESRRRKQLQRYHPLYLGLVSNLCGGAGRRSTILTSSTTLRPVCLDARLVRPGINHVALAIRAKAPSVITTAAAGFGPIISIYPFSPFLHRPSNSEAAEDWSFALAVELSSAVIAGHGELPATMNQSDTVASISNNMPLVHAVTVAERIAV